MAGNPDALQAGDQRRMLDLCAVEGAAVAATGAWECFSGPVQHLGLGRS